MYSLNSTSSFATRENTMLQSLSEGPGTFTLERVREIFRTNVYRGEPVIPQNHTTLERVEPKPYVLKNLECVFPPTKPPEEFVKELYSAAQHPENHLREMDAVLRTYYHCVFHPTTPEEEILDRTCRLLKGLPATPLELNESEDGKTYEHVPLGYFLNAQGPRKWHNFSAVHVANTSSILLALYLSMRDIKQASTNWESSSQKFADSCADLLKAAFDLSTQNPDPQSTWCIVKAFIWTSWQRAIIIHCSFMLNRALLREDTRDIHKFLTLKGTSLVRGLHQDQSLSAISVPYMCSWALKLLQSDRASIGQDFRRLKTRYATLFGHLPPRCNQHPDGTFHQCDGTFLEKCTRFKGMKIKDQSAHSPSCSGSCQRLYWNENSYKAVSGSRAVLALPSDDGKIRYCAASPRTMAISHVWSHGQGGRPEADGTGFNRCLHQRYCNIAQQFQCDSYWMDTPCIPSDHKLRAEAIRNINMTFAGSKITLVCDRDLMEISVSALDPPWKESILATLLVCDWNVRAWTLLEAIRGRNNVNLLFKHGAVIALRDLLENVNNNGSIDIAILFVTAHHLLPSPRFPVDPSGRPLFTEADYHYRHFKKGELGFISLEDAGCILSRRHASRTGDDVIIWSLLIDETPYDTPEAFWSSRVDKSLHVSLLVSSAPRMSTMNGFSWAPRMPGLIGLGGGPGGRFYPHDGDGGSASGWVNEDGVLRASWFTHDIDNTLLPGAVHEASSAICSRDKLIRDIAESHLQGYSHGRLHQMAPDLYGPGVTEPFSYRGRVDGRLMVVVGSNDEDFWTRKGLYEWDTAIPLPKFKHEDILLA